MNSGSSPDPPSFCAQKLRTMRRALVPLLAARSFCQAASGGFYRGGNIIYDNHHTEKKLEPLTKTYWEFAAKVFSASHL